MALKFLHYYTVNWFCNFQYTKYEISLLMLKKQYDAVLLNTLKQIQTSCMLTNFEAINIAVRLIHYVSCDTRI